MLWLVFLAQVAAPQPVGPAIQFDSRHAPEGSYRSDRPMVVKYALSVSPSGRVYDCEVEASSGYPELDAKTCELASESMRFRPAIDASRQAAYGIYREDANWWFIPKATNIRAIPQVEFTVKQLPADIKPPAIVDLDLALDATGRALACSPAARETRDVLATALCGQMTHGFSLTAQKNEAGERVASVQTVTTRVDTK